MAAADVTITVEHVPRPRLTAADREWLRVAYAKQELRAMAARRALELVAAARKARGAE